MGSSFLRTAAITAVPALGRLVRHRDVLLGQNQRLRTDIDRLRTDIDRLQLQLDALRGGSAAAESPDDRAELRYLFVVTYGRSGSTLLMSLLDGTPGYCIRGENGGGLHRLFEYHSAALDARVRWAGDEPLTPQNPWYGIDEYPPALAVARMRQLVTETLLRPEPGTRVAGFKEIRWWQSPPDDYLAFVETLFPGARFILNTRNLADVARSRWNNHTPNALADLAMLEGRLREAVDKRAERGYHVHFDDYVKDPSALRGLFDWLGEGYNEERVARTLAVRHSF
ncbi:sulfotransferase [Actinopolymorpha sp. NPDC004070]|uniref:sulfotransferase n=1 Tax=Actinopolymorpha sp. NPDC004070 TaxID=3154548 RepID=UPI0033A34EBA